MEKIISAVLTVMILSAVSASAVITFTDDFERSVTGPQYAATDPNYTGVTVGSQYTVLSGAWNISNADTAGRVPNFVTASSYAVSSIMIVNSIETLRDADKSFTLSADVWSGGVSTAKRQGVVFNCQDENNFYALEYYVETDGVEGSLRLMQYVDGTGTVLDAKSGLALSQYTYYTMTVEADGTNVIGTLKTTGGAEISSITNSTTTYMDGTAGLWRNSSSSVAYDNFVLNASEPTPDVLITDDFERPTTGPQYAETDPNYDGIKVGSQYTVLSGAWNISNADTAGRVPNFVTASSYAVSSVMIVNSIETLRDTDKSFTLSVDAWNGGTGTAKRQGVVFNCQDENNFYALEYYVETDGTEGSLRLLQYVDGTGAVLDAKSGLALSKYTYYTVAVRADVTGIIGTLATTGGTPLASVAMDTTTYTNGYAGFWKNSTSSVGYDNFSLGIYGQIPVPSPATMSVTAANGTITITAGNLSSLSAIANILQSTTNLVSGTWSNLYTVTSVTETNWTFSTDETQRFFRVLKTY